MLLRMMVLRLRIPVLLLVLRLLMSVVRLRLMRLMRLMRVMLLLLLLMMLLLRVFDNRGGWRRDGFGFGWRGRLGRGRRDQRRDGRVVRRRRRVGDDVRRRCAAERGRGRRDVLRGRERAEEVVVAVGGTEG